MSESGNKFLALTLGEQGARALFKAAERYPDLGGALLPRAIIAWLSAEARLRDFYEGSVPGTDAGMSFKKSEGGYTGSVTLPEGKYEFEGATLFHVAGAIAVALEADVDAAGRVRDSDVERLGKNIDLLAKALAVSKELGKMCKVVGCSKAEHKHDLTKLEPPGTTAKPNQPQEPAQPEGPKLKAPAAMKPKSAKKPPSLHVLKAESGKACQVCSSPNIEGASFVGCLCFRSLAKSVKTTAVGDQLHLEFGTGWDRDGVLALAEIWNK